MKTTPPAARIMVAVSVLLCTSEALSQRPPRVLIDGSHEFTFAWSTDWWDGTFARSYLAPDGIQYTYSWATLDTSVYHYDVVVTYQVTTALPYSKPEQNLLRAYVAAGGGLLIVGKGPAWEKYAPHQPGDAYPLGNLSALFGMQFTTATAGKPFRILPHAVTAGVTGFDNDGLAAGTLTMSAGVETLIVDPTGNAIMGAASYGQGRVVVIAENDCVPTSVPLPAPARNDTLLRNAVRWLAAAMIARNPLGTIPERVYPEKTASLGPLTVRYASALSTRVGFITTVYPFINSQLEAMLGVKNVSTLFMVALATGGGGYSGGDEIGVGILTEDKAVFGVLAHELTHSFQRPGGEPVWMGEGWATLSAFRVQTAYGYDMRNDRQSYDSQFHTSDPTGSALDLSTSQHANEPGYPAITAYMGKCMSVIETLELRYHADLMRRYFVLVRTYPSLQGSTSDQTVYRLCAAAGADLYPYFQSIGTTVSPRAVLPLVLSTAPAHASDTASAECGIQISFTEPIDTASVSAGGLQMEGSSSGALQGAIAWADSYRTMNIAPQTPLEESETVTITLLPSVVAADGRPLDGNGNGHPDGAADAYRFFFNVRHSTGTGALEETLPEELILWQNYPNPFNAATTIQFQIPAGGRERETGASGLPVTLRVFDMLGRETATLVAGERPPGVFKVTFDVSTEAQKPVASGPYFYTLECSAHRITKRMVLLR